VQIPKVVPPLFDDDETEPNVLMIEKRGPSSPWSPITRPLIMTPRPEEIDFEAAIESFTETQPLSWEEVIDLEKY
jgi:hypothetical protein